MAESAEEENGRLGHGPGSLTRAPGARAGVGRKTLIRIERDRARDIGRYIG
jgi:hypothetical protein